MLNNFVALDFETASGKNPCSIGIVEFENGRIVSQYYSLINPMIDKFNPYTVRIHGIRKEDVESKRNFKEIWVDVKRFIENKIIVCHQSSTDISVLKYSLEKYKIDMPNFESICTLKLSKSYLNLEKNNLNIVADFFNISQNSHHNALEDALVCGKIFLNFIRKINDFEQIKEVGGYYINGRTPKKRSYNFHVDGDETFCNVDDYLRKKEMEKQKLYSFKSISSNIGKKNQSNKLQEQTFVVTGIFINFSRADIKKSIEDNGGKVSSAISKKTNYIIAGVNMGPAKKAKAESLNIPIISENDYLKMI
ncbi:MAG: 3'-5' exoribonuclease [Flavobacteriaceae bacterium]|nr:3'-5' exoribonuclease [Flavobacteriaceae bacterium]